MGSINRRIFRTRVLYVRSLRSDKHPWHSGKGICICQCIILYSLPYDANDVMNDDNHVTELSAQILVNVMLIGMIRKPSVEPIVMAKQWGIISEKAQKTVQVSQRLCFILHYLDY